MTATDHALELIVTAARAAGSGIASGGISSPSSLIRAGGRSAAEISAAGRARPAGSCMRVKSGSPITPLPQDG